MERQPSEVIQEFLELLDESHEHFNASSSLIEEENRRTLSNTHSLEDCSDEELFDFAYRWREDLRERRKECDRKAMYEHIHKFSISENNKPVIKRLRGLLAEQKITEEYLSTPYEQREFKNGDKKNNE